MPEVTISKASSDKEIAAWISNCISTRQGESEEANDQSVAICISQARKATGKPVRRGA